jgi:transposase
VLAVLNHQIKQLERQVETHFHQHPDAEIYLSQPGIGMITGARVLAEFADPDRYACAKARKNYAATSPDGRF